MTHPDEIPALVYADQHGTVCDFPDLAMAGMANGSYFKPALDDLIALPEGSELFVLPDRLPVGTDPANGEPLLLAEDPVRSGRSIQAVAAFMAPAHTAVYTAAYQAKPDPVLLPLFAYTAVGWLNGRFWVAAFRSDPDQRQDANNFKQSAINRKTEKKLKKYKNNRLIQHLGKCCLTYHCPAARNFFLGRWEAPLPTSPHCNARCLGCISQQPAECCPATQDRITFSPSVQEILEVAVPHLNNSVNPVVSFGQGCEGEPLLQAKLLAEAVREMRSSTSKGTINVNTNASLPQAIALLAENGLDSIRVSLNSARKYCYDRYYRPVNYTFSSVKESIVTMKQAGKFVSLNYFILPGFTDSHPETEAFLELVGETRPDYIQLRNLNMDPDWYLKSTGHPTDSPLYGMSSWLDLVKRSFPDLQFGYFNPCLNKGDDTA